MELEVTAAAVGVKGVFLQVRQSTRTGVSRQVLEMERCEEILQKMVKFRYSWPFR